MSELAAIVTNDPVIGRQLGHILESERWDQITGLSRDRRTWHIGILKYRPERRLCLRIRIPHQRFLELDSFFIAKLWYNKRGKLIHQNICWLNEQLNKQEELQVPKSLFYDSQARAMVYQEVSGTTLTSVLRRGCSRDWTHPVAGALAKFHSLRNENLQLRSAEDELSSVKSLLKRIGDPALANILKRQLVNLAESAPPIKTISLLHRDLYDQQVLSTPTRQVVLIDLDDMASGDAMLDVGNLLAHIHLMKYWRSHAGKHARMEERFLEAYGQRAEVQTDTLQTLPWYKRVSLCRLASLQAIKNNDEISKQLLMDAEDMRKNNSTFCISR